MDPHEDGSPDANFDVTADGRFVTVRHAARLELVLLQNWQDVARRSAPPTTRRGSGATQLLPSNFFFKASFPSSIR